jgi:hypothetical protein
MRVIIEAGESNQGLVPRFGREGYAFNKELARAYPYDLARIRNWIPNCRYYAHAPLLSPVSGGLNGSRKALPAGFRGKPHV